MGMITTGYIIKKTNLLVVKFMLMVLKALGAVQLRNYSSIWFITWKSVTLFELLAFGT